MRNTTAKSIDLRLSSLARRAMLWAMMMYTVAFGVAALVVAFALWREAPCSPTPQKFHPLYMVLSAPEIAERPGQS
jgi:hypothetical protein